MLLLVMAIALVLLLLISIPVIMLVASAMGFAMPWLLLGVIFWAVFSGGRRSRRHGWRMGCGRSEPIPISQARTARQTRPRPEMPAAPNELPIDVQIKVEQIRRKVEVLLGYASRFPPFSRDLYLVRQTANDYLPRTIHWYMALAPGARERLVAANGKTPLQELREQLDLLDSKLNEIAEDLQRRDLDRLLANRRFLEERFGEQTA